MTMPRWSPATARTPVSAGTRSATCLSGPDPGGGPSATPAHRHARDAGRHEHQGSPPVAGAEFSVVPGDLDRVRRVDGALRLEVVEEAAPGCGSGASGAGGHLALRS